MLFRPAQGFQSIKYMDNKKLNQTSLIYSTTSYTTLLRTKEGSWNSFLSLISKVMNRREAGDDKALVKNPWLAGAS